MSEGSFQQQNWEWILECFGERFARSTEERALRFLEEALELAQAAGIDRDHALTVVSYVYDRAVGETRQEVGGTMVCLAALCSQLGIDLDEAAWRELARCRLNTEKIRGKHLAKPLGIRTNDGAGQ
jgi:NTP pyrophosphatase (non-canonical NTP hydrolase)